MDIIQWNVNSFFQRKNRLRILMSERNPSCLCLQETNFKSDYCASIKNYSAVFKNRPADSQASGGVATFVKTNLFLKEIPLNTSLEAVAARIRIPDEITLCNIYLPNSKTLDKDDLDQLITQLPPPYIIVGDFNSHNELWGSTNSDARGKIVEKWTENHELIILNSGQQTHFNFKTLKDSAIDLSLSSPDIAPMFEWQASEDLHDSDHYPIFITPLKFSILPHQTKHPKWILSEANWPKYRTLIDGGIVNLEKSTDFSPTDINEIVAKFNELIHHSAGSSIPQPSGKPSKHKIPWLNPECIKKIKESKKTFRKMKKNNNLENQIEFKKARAEARLIVRESATNSWEHFVSTITPNTPVTTLWKKVKSLKGIKTSDRPTFLETSNSKILNIEEICNHLAETFANNSSDSNYDQKFLKYKEKFIKNNPPDQNSNPQPHLDPINKSITIEEIYHALSESGNSSPGPDDIPNDLLKNLPESGIKYLSDIYNSIWTNNTFPDLWRESVVIPIPKPGKDHSKANNYRPISLTCNMCKILEKIVSSRLRWKLESENILSPLQNGFRENRSTLDHLVNLEAEACDAIAQDGHLVVVSMDLEKAYEMVWKDRIISLLEQMEINGHSLNFIKNFLKNRKFRVRINDNVSNPTETKNGIPQGSVISVILFLIAINNILSCITSPVKASLFADDLSIRCYGKNMKTTVALIQKVLDNLAQWGHKTGFKFSKTKTEFMVITRSKYEEPELKLDGAPLKKQSTLKILGLTFDEKLSWVPHIKGLKTECTKRLNIIKTISSTRFGARESCLLKIYRAIIQSKIDYGSIIYGSANANILKTLDVIHHSALRLSLGAFKSSPVSSLLAETGEIPLSYRRKYLCLKYASSISSLPTNPAMRNTTKTDLFDTYEAHKNLQKPLRFRCAKYIQEADIPFPTSMKRDITPIPPWDPPTPQINLELSDYNRSTTTSTTYCKLFNEIQQNFLDHTQLFTDGSLIDGSPGCAITTEDEELFSCKLPDQFSIFSCEAFAVEKSLQLIEETSNNKKSVIFSDSKSTLTAIKNKFNKNPIINKIQGKLRSLEKKRISVSIIWIPAHQGIKGNEKADEAAKAATKNLKANPEAIPTIPENKKFLMNKTKRKWNDEWKALRTNLHKIRATTEEQFPFSPKNRKEQCTINRLRIGHTNFSHSYLMSKESPPHCPRCDTPLSVNHVLIECPQWSRERARSSLPKDLKLMLTTQEGCIKTIEFMKSISLYHKV